MIYDSYSTINIPQWKSFNIGAYAGVESLILLGDLSLAFMTYFFFFLSFSFCQYWCQPNNKTDHMNSFVFSCGSFLQQDCKPVAGGRKTSPYADMTEICNALLKKKIVHAYLMYGNVSSWKFQTVRAVRYRDCVKRFWLYSVLSISVDCTQMVWLRSQYFFKNN